MKDKAKIVYVLTGFKGHNLIYLQNIVRDRQESSVVITPEYVESLKCSQHIVAAPVGKNRSFYAYIKWLHGIKKIVNIEKPGLLHFLSGDDFYRYFGLGLFIFNKYPVLMTLHWVRGRSIEHLSLKCISKSVSQIVVHSSYLQEQLKKIGVNNTIHIEYPQFDQIYAEKGMACVYWGLNPKIKTIACIGGTRFDKGLDILMKALSDVSVPFQLLIAGEDNHFSEADVREMGSGYSDKLFANIHYLTDEELAYAFAASDIIALPYRKTFNGASGPLTEGVAYNKCIVSSDHGNLGYTVKKNHLGYVFESENVHELGRVLAEALAGDFCFDECYVAYKRSLHPDLFREEYEKCYMDLI